MNNATETGTGYYYYFDGSDGLCEYSTKSATVNNAKSAQTMSGWIDIVSPSGRVVATIRCNKIGVQV